MPQTHMCSIVFVGTQFLPSMLDERTLFDGHLDPEQVKVGPIGQFTYQGGRYGLDIALNRVDVKEPSATNILSPALLTAARESASSLEALRRVITVNAMGINCDTILPAHALRGMTGTDFCSLLVTPALTSLYDDPIIPFVRTRSPFLSGIRDVRIEPHVASNGNDLFVAFNMHYEVLQSITLDKILNDADTLRSFIESLHDRIFSLAKGSQNANGV